jgi:hypothetical protein
VRPAIRRGARAAATAWLLVLASAGCVSDNIPARPSVITPAPGPDDAGAGPRQLASAPGCGSINLVVANGVLFWTEKAHGTVKSVPTAGGPVTVIASGQAFPGPIATDGAFVFWVNTGDKTIMRKTLFGTGVATVFVKATTAPELLGGENDINGLLVDHGTLYFGRFTAALRMPTSGAVTPKVIGLSPMTDQGNPTAFAIDATHLYQTEGLHNAVSRELLDGTQQGRIETGAIEPLAPDRIAVSQGALLLDAIAVVNGYVLWANNSSIHAKAVATLEHDPFLTVASTLTFDAVTGFVVSDGVIYLGDSGDNAVNRVVKMPLLIPAPVTVDGGDTDAGVVDAEAGDAADAADDADIPDGASEPAAAVVVATKQVRPSQFAADDTNIYWRTEDCKIMKLAK